MGVYQHYKGGRYLLLTIAETHDHNGDRDCVYVSLTTGKIVTRPLMKDSRNADSWTDVVEWPDGVRRPRFVEPFRSWARLTVHQACVVSGDEVFHELPVSEGSTLVCDRCRAPIVDRTAIVIQGNR